MSRHITPSRARAIAYQWHASMLDPIYAFASSGIVVDHNALLASMRDNLRWLESRGKKSTRDWRDLNACYRFARDCLSKEPDGALYAPWEGS